ncbi:hypothetical protein PL11_008355 [Lentilactobacillus curieae]|uniref:DUF1516 family protein n=1 Tax=Lentilactobacillus curieae TaxID=1138822 RepID=A0A1S6QK14_9LACO|nr:DUF1516 family protein [Lentilactobacillus curieae]AQW21923.1 hypothetical protein PL11_008355 [Lentilactobacillus curieae]
MWIAINYICWVGLIFAVLFAITRTTKKRVIQSMMYSRLFYWGIMISQVVIDIRSFERHPVFIIISAILTLIAIALSETIIGRKQDGILKIKTTATFVVVAVIAILLQSAVNF